MADEPVYYSSGGQLVVRSQAPFVVVEAPAEARVTLDVLVAGRLAGCWHPLSGMFTFEGVDGEDISYRPVGFDEHLHSLVLERVER